MFEEIFSSLESSLESSLSGLKVSSIISPSSTDSAIELVSIRSSWVCIFSNNSSSSIFNSFKIGNVKYLVEPLAALGRRKSLKLTGAIILSTVNFRVPKFILLVLL
eukprot:NODE_3_length_80033_cov_0.932970.p76 type:complete len:106 gc:universal NODE_3_length_80033_cov_0.932970:50020-50337(+)